MLRLTLPELSCQRRRQNIIITHKNDGQNYKNKTKVMGNSLLKDIWRIRSLQMFSDFLFLWIPAVFFAAFSEEEVNMWITGLNWLMTDTQKAPAPQQIDRCVIMWTTVMCVYVPKWLQIHLSVSNFQCEYIQNRQTNPNPNITLFRNCWLMFYINGF